jgi:hypothetical protein
MSLLCLIALEEHLEWPSQSAILAGKMITFMNQDPRQVAAPLCCSVQSRGAFQALNLDHYYSRPLGTRRPGRGNKLGSLGV